MFAHADQVESAGQALKKARVERLSTQEFDATAGGVAELLEWPEQIADMESIWVARTGLQSQLRESLNRKIWLTSAYSGMCTFRARSCSAGRRSFALLGLSLRTSCKPLRSSCSLIGL